MTSRWQQDCLLARPFDGDYSDGERTLSDKMVTARKSHHCHGVGEACERGVVKGDRSRALVEVNRGDCRTYRWCEPCCQELALSILGKAKWQSSHLTTDTRSAPDG